MEARRRTWFDERGLVIATPSGERRLPFYGATMHYWQVPPVRWGASLRALHAQGFTLVETFVPWRVHEPEAGERAWTAERDLPRFLEAAQAAGLHVVLRPGPSASAELTSNGLPDWVLSDPVCQAQTAQGTAAWFPAPPRAFPIPSYASFAFHAHVRAWYAAVGEVVRPYLAPDGPVVAIGVDNAAQLFLRTGAFDLDYHPDALVWWREASGLDEPPRAWAQSDAARCVLWLKHKDEYLARALGAFARMLDDAGFAGVARLHGLLPGHYGLFDVRQLQSAIGGPVAMAAASTRGELTELRRRAAFTTGNASPVPLVLEAGVGQLPWLPPLDEADDPTRERDQLLTLLAGGIRGFNLAMGVEGARHDGAVVSLSGQVEAPWVKPLLAALAEVEWPALHRHAAIALVDTRADARFGVLTNVLDPVPPVVAEFLSAGPGGAAELGTDTSAIAARRWQTAIARALELAQVPYLIVDEATPEDELARYRAVIAPTLERIDRGLFQRLRAVVEHKRAVVVIGPGTPSKDELDQPLVDPLPKRVGKLKAGSLDDIPGLAEDLAALAGEVPEAWQIERPDDVRAFAFANATHHVRVVIVANDGDRAVTAVLLADGNSLRDPLANETIAITGGRASVAMKPRGVRLLIAE